MEGETRSGRAWAVLVALLCGAALSLITASAAAAAGRWSLVPQPQYRLGAGDTGQFEISCLSNASCVAFGSAGRATR